MSFADTLRGAATRLDVVLPPAHHPEPLAGLPYPEELAVKRAGIEAFWREHELPGAPESIVPAPLPRGYRTTSKRRASLDGGRRLTLDFPGARAAAGTVAPSRLDPPEHLAVYALLVDRLARPAGLPLARVLTHAVVRGGPGALALVLNVREFDARVVRAAKNLTEPLQAAAQVRALFLYLDPTGSDYYLEARRPSGVLAFKHVFGPGTLGLEVAGASLRFPPTVFSQVNAAMLPEMIATARQALAPLRERHLIDLFCGYGLFSLTVGADAARVTGIDLDGPAISAARANAAHLGRSRSTRFVAGRIDAPGLARLPASSRQAELVLLDPPRQGTAPGVAAALAARRPERVVHICCGTDEIPREVAAWRTAGLALRRAVPLDLFAGTANLETVLLLTP